MWSSRIFSLVGRVSSPQAASGMIRRNFLTPAATIHHHHGSQTNNSGYNALNNILTPFQETRRCMSKFLSKSATKRLPLNTKRAKKGYYKGKGCTSEGRLTSKGKFIADPLKKLQLIVPDLNGFPLKPYIAKTISKFPPEDRRSLQPGA